jgi:hypothetical protein
MQVSITYVHTACDAPISLLTEPFTRQAVLKAL